LTSRRRLRRAVARSRWWRTPAKLDASNDVTAIFLPARAPELNPVENVWEYLGVNGLSNRVFETYDAINDAACEASRKPAAKPATINSIGTRD